MLKQQMEHIYKNMDLDKIPWNMHEPPKLLTDFVINNISKKSKVIELGCGVGNYVMYFSKMGFQSTGVDFCETAIHIAREKSKGLNCSFFVADAVKDLSIINNTYDFIYDWELLHHIFPDHREKYLQNVKKLLKPGGYYLSVCFSEKSHQFGGKGKYRKTPLDTELYFSSEDEMHRLFSSQFAITHLSTEKIEGKHAPHQAIYAVLNNKKSI